MTAIELRCLICKKSFWSSGFDHVCYECACKQSVESYEAKTYSEIDFWNKFGIYYKI